MGPNRAEFREKTCFFHVFSCFFVIFRDFWVPLRVPQKWEKTRPQTCFFSFLTGSGRILAGSGGTCTRSWEGLTARGGLDGPHLGHPLRRDQVHVCVHFVSILIHILCSQPPLGNTACEEEWTGKWTTASRLDKHQHTGMYTAQLYAAVCDGRDFVPVTCVEKPDPRSGFRVRLRNFLLNFVIWHEILVGSPLFFQKNGPIYSYLTRENGFGHLKKKGT